MSNYVLTHKINKIFSMQHLCLLVFTVHSNSERNAMMGKSPETVFRPLIIRLNLNSDAGDSCFHINVTGVFSQSNSTHSN